MRNEQSKFQTPLLQYQQSELFAPIDKPSTQSQGNDEPTSVLAPGQYTQARLNHVSIPIMETPKDHMLVPSDPPEPKLTVSTNTSSNDAVLAAYYTYGRRRSLTCVGNQKTLMIVAVCILVGFLLLFMVAGFLK
jgi:hypothetical protein